MINRNYFSDQFISIFILERKKDRVKKLIQQNSVPSSLHNGVYVLYCIKRNSPFYFSYFISQNEKKKRKLSETSSEITEMKVKYLR